MDCLSGLLIDRLIAATITCQPIHQLRVPRLTPFSQRRTLFGGIREKFFGGKGSGKEPINPRVSPKDTLAEKYLKRKPTPPKMARGGLGKSSIFDGAEDVDGKKRSAASYEQESRNKPQSRDPALMKAALDPNPEARIRWQRKMVIREVRKRGRMTRKQVIKRTEREMIAKSHSFKTSVKKLVPLAKQITGKSVADAIIQMRFSVKKAAKDVKEHLEHAKNEAVVRRGMGIETSKFNPIHIQTKDKKTVRVNNPTSMYVEQAWVGRSQYGKSMDYRARGRVHIMKNPTTSEFRLTQFRLTTLRCHTH
jgi:ribosomal protein L22